MTSVALPGMTWLYFALIQFPYYLAPYMLTPIARRLTSQATGATAAGSAP
jgi:BASS family bile acid:Na+ symporter